MPTGSYSLRYDLATASTGRGIQTVSMPCPRCGAEADGRFCTRCGERLDEGHRESAILTLLNTLVRLDSWRSFFRIYWKILRRPVVNTVELFEEGDFQAIRGYFEIATIFVILSFSTTFVRGGGNLAQEVVLPLYLIVTAAGFPVIFRWFGRRASRVPRTDHEILSMYFLQTGFGGPLGALIYLLQWYVSPFFVFSFVPLGIFGLIYITKIWTYFWRIGAGRVMFYQMMASIIPAPLSLALLIPLGYHPWEPDPTSRRLTQSFDSLDRRINSLGIPSTKPQWAPLTAHAGGVDTVVFSPIGHLLVSAGKDHRARLWDIADPAHPRPLGELPGTAGDLSALAFSDDGSLLAGTGPAATLRIWNLSSPKSPQYLETLSLRTGRFVSVAFSPAGDSVAAGDSDGTTLLWNLADQASLTSPLRLTYDRPAKAVTRLAFSPTQKTLVTGTEDGLFEMWDVSKPGAATSTAGFIVKNPGGGPGAVFDRTGTRLAIATGNGAGLIRLSDTGTVSGIDTTTGNPGRAVGATFSPDGATMIAAGATGRVQVWSMADVANPVHRRDLVSRSGITSVSVSADERTIATGRSDGTIQLWAMPG